jgi:hypothetical protein
MALRSEKRSPASLAGWLFADLSIVLMILFASTGLSSKDVRCEKQDKLAADSPCKKVPASTSTSTTIKPSPPGIRPKPIEVTIDGVRDISPAAFQDAIEKEIRLLEKSDIKLKDASKWDFGVILIYGGAMGRKKSSDGDRIAEIAMKKISPVKQPQWKKVRDTTFYEPGHDMSLPYGSVKLKLFPIIS